MAIPSADDRLEWSIRATRSGTEVLLSLIEEVEKDLGASSLLPGWSRAHVLAHVAHNAEALLRLLKWASTGVETPMYSSPEQRDAQIEETSRQPGNDLKRNVHRTALDLDRALSSHPEEAWQAKVRTARGRPILASEIPWMRCREVWMHGIDLAVGAPAARLPDDVIDALLDDVFASFEARGDVPPIVFEPTDRTRIWRIGSSGSSKVLRGKASDTLCWMVGRARPTDMLAKTTWAPPTWR